MNKAKKMDRIGVLTETIYFALLRSEKMIFFIFAKRSEAKM